MSGKRFAICKCFFTRNIFIKKLNFHVEYLGDEALKKVLFDHGVIENELPGILDEIKLEIRRRENFQQNILQSKLFIAQNYQPLHPEVYNLSAENHLHPSFLEIVLSRNYNDFRDHGQKVFSFPVFTDEFCLLLLQELKHLKSSKLPLNIPNSMNKEGVLLDELGFTPFIDRLRLEYLNPLCERLFPGKYEKFPLDSHRAFVVLYQEGGDTGLHSHFDNAEITLNVSLSDEHEDGELIFNGLKTEPERQSNIFAYQHVLGRGVLHRGSHIHSALPISSGDRWNLIIWMRRSVERNLHCPMCNDVPNLVPVHESSYGDGFTLK